MINVGVIGYGYWGPNLVRNFVEAPGSRVVAVSDLQDERLAKVQARYPQIGTTTKHRELLDNPTIDAIVIATPVSTHFDLAMQALRSGKHVLVEKPLAATSEQGERLVEEAARCKRVLMADHTFVYTGAVRKIKELVQGERLGQIYYYDSVRVNLGLFQHDVNVLWDLAAHDLSIMDYVLDEPPCAVSAIGTAHVPGQPRNMAYLTCLFSGSLIAHFHVNWLAPVKIRHTLIGGERQMIVYDDLEPSEKIKVYDRGITLNDGAEGRYQLLVGYRSGDMWAPQLSTAEALGVMARHFLECIEQDRQPLTNGHVGLRVVQMLEAATQSIMKRGRLVELETAEVTA
jgi:predicted dehydrogenase